MLVVKPDGISRVNSIRDLLIKAGLTIERESNRRLSAKAARALYWEVADVRHRENFPELVEHMSSAPVHIFLIKGKNAVVRVRRIIGKRDPPSGIRAKWAIDVIRNVAHGPHSEEAARREIQIVMEEGMRKVFMIGGMSESGKSSLGKYLDAMGLRRLKIVDFLKRVKERLQDPGDFYEWNNRNVAEKPEWVRQQFVDEFIRWTEAERVEYCCLESLYGPELGVYMKERLGNDVAIIVYVDIPEAIRLERQMIRQGLATLDEAKQLLLPRDDIKRAWHVPEIAEVADVIVDNSGTLQQLYQRADEMVAEFCPECTAN